MDRTERRATVTALNAYITAFQPTSRLALELAGALGQMLANDRQGTVTITLPGNVSIVRHPHAVGDIALTFSRMNSGNPDKSSIIPRILP